LPLHVLAVILSAAKYPEELNKPKPFPTFEPIPSTFLPLPVPAVILSAAKDPEELNEPKPFIPFNPHPSTPLPLSVLSNPRKTLVISTEAADASVSSAAEKSASHPKPYPSQKNALLATPYSLP
jgi:hypothetical protein